jgi:hypothetical protein
VTKAELIAQVAAETELTKVDTRRVLDSVMSCLTKALKKESRFALPEQVPPALMAGSAARAAAGAGAFFRAI